MGIEKLIQKDEGVKLDFKRDYELGKEKSEYLKDIIALANGSINTIGETAYLIFGIKEVEGAKNEIYGVNIEKNSQTIQQHFINRLNSCLVKPIQELNVKEFELESKKVLVVEIPFQGYLLILKEDLKGTRYKKGNFLYRVGEQTQFVEDSYNCSVRKNFEEALERYVTESENYKTDSILNKTIKIGNIKGIVDSSNSHITQNFYESSSKNTKSNQKYYFIISSLIIILTGFFITFSQKDTTSIVQNIESKSPHISNTSGNIVIEYSTKIYNKEKEKKYEIEFVNLLKIFSPPYGMDWTLGALDWSIGANSDSKIKWLYDGIQDVELELDNQYSPVTLFPYVREGQVVILNNGKPSHTILKKTKQPVKWSIKLWGVRSGVDMITISNSVYSQKDSRLIIPEKFIKSMKDMCPNPSYVALSFQLFEVSLPSRSTFWILEHGDGGGTAGMIYEYTLLLQKPTNKQMNQLLKDCREF